jgi:hypothetical protein
VSVSNIHGSLADSPSVKSYDGAIRVPNPDLTGIAYIVDSELFEKAAREDRRKCQPTVVEA